MLCRMQVPLQMDHNWLMITHVIIGVTKQMNFLIKTAVIECNMAIKKFRFLTNHASSLMKDRIYRKATHQHTLVGLRRMAVLELQNLHQCFITDLFGPWTHVFGNVFSTKVVTSILETLLFWAVSISTRTCNQYQWRFTWSWNYCKFCLNNTAIVKLHNCYLLKFTPQIYIEKYII